MWRNKPRKCFLKRSRRKNNHHIIPRSRGGSSVESNLLRMDINRHCAWHLLFHNLTFLEAAALLERVYRCKQRRES